MICKVISRLSKSKFRVESVNDGKKITVSANLLDNLSVNDYVVVTDLCIVSKTTYNSSQQIFRV